MQCRTRQLLYIANQYAYTAIWIPFFSNEVYNSQRSVWRDRFSTFVHKFSVLSVRVSLHRWH
jgi:hypothetical protein